MWALDGILIVSGKYMTHIDRQGSVNIFNSLKKSLEDSLYDE